MLYLYDIKVEFESQGFKGTHIGISSQKIFSMMILTGTAWVLPLRYPASYCSSSGLRYNSSDRFCRPA